MNNAKQWILLRSVEVWWFYDDALDLSPISAFPLNNFSAAEEQILRLLRHIR